MEEHLLSTCNVLGLTLTSRKTNKKRKKIKQPKDELKSSFRLVKNCSATIFFLRNTIKHLATIYFLVIAKLLDLW